MQNFVEKLKRETNKSDKAPISEIGNVVMTDDFANQLLLVQELRKGTDIEKIVTPLNATEERQAFESGDCHPVFEYNRELLNEVSSIFEDDGASIWRTYNVADGTIRGMLVHLLENRTRDLCCTAEFVSAMESHSPHWQNELMREKFGDISEDLAIEAAMMLDELRFPDEFPKRAQHPRNEEVELNLALMQFDAKGIKEQFELALGKYGFEVPVKIGSYPKVTVVYNCTGIAIGIPKGITINGIRLLELIRHKVECHVRSYMNNEALLRPYGLRSGIGAIDNDILSEGYALLEEEKLHQRLFGIGKQPTPWGTLAVDLAKEGNGFVQAANKLREYLSDCNYSRQAMNEIAWECTYNVFRGSQNTFKAREESESFVFTKAKLGLEGYLLAKELEEADLHHWLEIGGLRPDELLELAKVVDFQPKDIPYKDKRVTFQIYNRLI